MPKDADLAFSAALFEKAESLYTLISKFFSLSSFQKFNYNVSWHTSLWDLLNFFVSFAKLGKFLLIISYYVISKKLCLLVYL